MVSVDAQQCFDADVSGDVIAAEQAVIGEAGKEKSRDQGLRNGCFWRILLKKSFFAMTENSQDRWCVSLAAT